jgi:hypothetical protein
MRTASKQRSRGLAISVFGKAAGRIEAADGNGSPIGAAVRARATNGHRTTRRSTVALRLCAFASICLRAGGVAAEESAAVVSPLCAAADVRLVTLIEAHGEAQDIAAETLAKAFFTVMEARKACNRGEVEAALELYDSIPLDAASPREQ